MSFASVGSPVYSTASTISLNPTAVGNFFILSVVSLTAADKPASVAATGITFTPLVSSVLLGTENHAVFLGKATATGATTATVTWAGGTPTIRMIAQQFSTSAGIAHVYLAGWNTQLNVGAVSPAVSTTAAGQLYWTYQVNNGTTTAGSATGWTYYVDANSNGVAYNPNLGVGTWGPGWGDAGPRTGIAVVLGETSTVATPLYQGASTWTITNAGTPAAANYFIAPQAQAPLVHVGDSFKVAAYANPFTVTALGSPFAGFVNITFSPAAPAAIASGAMVSQVQSFPTNELDAHVSLQLTDGSWNDITQYVGLDSDQGITITRGHPDESTTVSPSTCDLSLFNGDGRFTDWNLQGPYYGRLARNNLLRVETPDTITSLRLTDAASWAQTLSVPTPASTFEFQMDVELDNWQEWNLLAGQWDSDTQASWALNTSPRGFLDLWWTSDGSTHVQASTSNPIYVATNVKRMCIRVIFDYSNSQVRFYTAPSTAGLAGASWTLVGTYAASIGVFTGHQSALTVGAVPFSPYLTNASAYNGSYSNTSIQWGVNSSGKVYAARMFSGIAGSGGTAIAEADFTSLPHGTTTFSDPEGNGWTMAGTAAVSRRRTRFTGPVAAWPQSWSPAGNDAWTKIEAGGPLRQLGRTQNPTASSMVRAMTRPNAGGLVAPVAYWPCEDATGSTTIASGLASGLPMALSGTPSFAENSSFYASNPIPTLNASAWSGRVQPYSGNAAVAMGALVSIPSAGESTSTGDVLYRMSFQGGSIARMELWLNSTGGLRIVGYVTNATNSAIAFDSTFVAFAANGQNVLITAQWDGTNAVIQMGNTVGTYNGGTIYTVAYAGTVGQVAQVWINPNKTFSQTAVGQVFVQNADVSLLEFYGPVGAWNNELAYLRFRRLCLEEGIPFIGRGRANDSIVMGPQTVQTIDELLQECADADGGAWTELRQINGFRYITREALGNQSPKVTFDYWQDHLSGDLAPTKDDQTTINDVTVSQSVDGSSARVQQLTGPMGVNTVGRYDTEVTVNLANDSDLQGVAGFQVLRGTAPEARYPTVEFDLANASLSGPTAAGFADLDLGDAFAIVNTPAWIPGPVKQVVNQYTESLFFKAWTPSVVGVPASPYDTAQAPWDTTVPAPNATELSSTVSGALSPALNQYPYFMSPVGDQGLQTGTLVGWNAYLATIALDNSVTYPGGPFPWSCVVNGAQVYSTPVNVPVASYACSAFVYSPTAQQIQIGLSWYNSNTYVSQSTVLINVPAGVWTPVGCPAQAMPASGVNQVTMIVASTAGTLFAVQAAMLWSGSGIVNTTAANAPLWQVSTNQTPFLVASGNGASATPSAFTAGTATANVPVGQFVYAIATSSGATQMPASMKDSVGNTYLQCGFVNQGTSPYAFVFVAQVTTAIVSGSTTFTLLFPATGANWNFIAVAMPAGSMEQFYNNVASASSLSMVYEPDGANATILIMGAAGGAAPTVPAPFTALANMSGNSAGYAYAAWASDPSGAMNTVNVTSASTSTGWSQFSFSVASDFPIPASIAPVQGMQGEAVYVTGVSALSATSQTFTIVRGVNGVTGSFAAGAAISVNPSYVAVS